MAGRQGEKSAMRPARQAYVDGQNHDRNGTSSINNISAEYNVHSVSNDTNPHNSSHPTAGGNQPATKKAKVTSATRGDSSSEGQNHDPEGTSSINGSEQINYPSVSTNDTNHQTTTSASAVTGHPPRSNGRPSRGRTLDRHHQERDGSPPRRTSTVTGVCPDAPRMPRQRRPAVSQPRQRGPAVSQRELFHLLDQIRVAYNTVFKMVHMLNFDQRFSLLLRTVSNLGTKLGQIDQEIRTSSSFPSRQ